MTSNNNKIERIRDKLFIEHNIKLQEEWFDGCMDYFITEQPNLTIGKLFKEAFAQFLLEDIKETLESAFPSTILAKTGIWTPSKKITLQLQS
jgi:hypothetical protein